MYPRASHGVRDAGPVQRVLRVSARASAGPLWVIRHHHLDGHAVRLLLLRAEPGLQREPEGVRARSWATSGISSIPSGWAWRRWVVSSETALPDRHVEWHQRGPGFLAARRRRRRRRSKLITRRPRTTPAADVEESRARAEQGMLLLATLLLIQPSRVEDSRTRRVALPVAALSRSVLSTLNPMIALDTGQTHGPHPLAGDADLRGARARDGWTLLSFIPREADRRVFS